MILYGAVQITTLGEILGTISSTGSDSIAYSDTVISVDMANPLVYDLLIIRNLGVTHKWDLVNKVIAAREAQPTTLNKLTLTADGIDAITLSNSPSGTFTATNTTTRETVTGPISGTDAFSTTIQGSYKIKIESWPFMDFEATINAL